MKSSVFFILLFQLGCSFHSPAQEIDNIELFYQQILDEPEFIEVINNNPDILCDSSLLFIRTENYDERFDLFFQGNKIKILQYPDTAYCETISFRLFKNSKKKFDLSVNCIKPLPLLCIGQLGHGYGKCFRNLKI